MKTQSNGSTIGVAAQAALVAGLAYVAVVGTGCSSLVGEGLGAGDRGRILISADTEGMQAFSDLIQGSIHNGKASADKDTAHYQMRREQVRARALKHYSSYSASKPVGAVVPQERQGVQLGEEYK